MITEVTTYINNILWGEWQLLVYVLLFAGLWFSFHFKFIQLRQFRYMFSIIKGNKNLENSGVSSFQALCLGLSARVGTGNLAGVAMAISLGGSGAIFWMWVIAILGMATGFAESVLAQLYKIRDENNEFRGGPAYYISMGLGKKWLATLFVFCLFLCYGISLSAIQANTIADSLNYSFEIPGYLTATVLTALAALIVLGGMKTIAKFAEMIVPFMGITFLLTAIIITIINISAVPSMIVDIFSSAFGLNEAGAGALGAAIKYGIQRGLYSNEAGVGSVPQAAASATPVPNHPVSQGYVQMLGVFLDTMVLCTCTAFIILLANIEPTGKMEGIRVTQLAMTEHFGVMGNIFVAVAISLFAFTSIVANYAYAESNLHVFKLDNKYGRFAYTAIYLAVIFWGTNTSLATVWGMADMTLGFMALVNIFAIIQLTPTVKSLVIDYHYQLKKGKTPELKFNNIKFQGRIYKQVWDRD